MSHSQVDDSDATHAAPPTERQRLYLHVGLSKSGSTFLQSVLGSHRAELRDHGYVYPYVRQEAVFHAAVEMASNAAYWGLDEEEIRGTFAHLLRRGRRLDGTIVISHELFGGAKRRQIEAIGEHLAEFDVHVVVTVRNTGRTITAQWQERVKNGRRESFEEFSRHLLGRVPDQTSGNLPGFWRSQNLGWLLERWRPVAPPDRTHVVVTPARDAAPGELWRRFAEAIGLPPDVVDLSQVPPRNESLGVPQIAFLRLVLDALDGRLAQPWFSLVVKRWFAQTLLSAVPAAKPMAPVAVTQRLTEITEAWIDFVRSQGYRVYGDLDEVLPEIPPDGSRHPDHAEPGDILEGLPGVVAEMLLRVRDLTATVERLESENQAIADERDRLTSQLAQPSGHGGHRHRWWKF